MNERNKARGGTTLEDDIKIVQRAEDKSDKIWPQQFEIGLVYPDSTHIINISMQNQNVVVEDAVGLSKPLDFIYNYNGFGYGVFPIQPESLDVFLSLEDDTILYYKCSNYYHADSEYSIAWNDPVLAIDWGVPDPILAEKDRLAENFAKFENPF